MICAMTAPEQTMKNPWLTVLTFMILAHRPLKDIAYAKPTSDFLDIEGFAFERKARIASDYE